MACVECRNDSETRFCEKNYNNANTFVRNTEATAKTSKLKMGFCNSKRRKSIGPHGIFGFGFVDPVSNSFKPSETVVLGHTIVIVPLALAIDISIYSFYISVAI